MFTEQMVEQQTQLIIVSAMVRRLRGIVDEIKLFSETCSHYSVSFYLKGHIWLVYFVRLVSVVCLLGLGLWRLGFEAKCTLYLYLPIILVMSLGISLMSLPKHPVTLLQAQYIGGAAVIRWNGWHSSTNLERRRITMLWLIIMTSWILCQSSHDHIY